MYIRGCSYYDWKDSGDENTTKISCRKLAEYVSGKTGDCGLNHYQFLISFLLLNILIYYYISKYQVETISIFLINISSVCHSNQAG